MSVMQQINDRVEEIQHIHDVTHNRISNFRKELTNKGWTELEISNLTGFGSRETTIRYSQKTADAHCNGDIDQYIEINNKYRTMWVEAETTFDRMRKLKRPGKETKAIFDAMALEFSKQLFEELV